MNFKIVLCASLYHFNANTNNYSHKVELNYTRCNTPLTCTVQYVLYRLYSEMTCLTLSHPEALLWRVKLSGIRQSNITKGTVLAGLGGKGLRKRDGQVGPVNPGLTCCQQRYTCAVIFNCMFNVWIYRPKTKEPRLQAKTQRCSSTP